MTKLAFPAVAIDNAPLDSRSLDNRRYGDDGNGGQRIRKARGDEEKASVVVSPLLEEEREEKDTARSNIDKEDIQNNVSALREYNTNSRDDWDDLIAADDSEDNLDSYPDDAFDDDMMQFFYKQ